MPDCNMWICLIALALAAVVLACLFSLRARKKKSVALREDIPLIFNVDAALSGKGVRAESATEQFNLGACYFAGEGVARDYAAAVAWWMKAAAQGHAEAMYRLGNCYLDGKGVSRDAAQAMTWFRKAAARNYAFAQYSLALCYLQGMGVEASDRREAARWFKRAARLGDERAVTALRRIKHSE
ncbi:MAG: sel1 repeat family protein [Prevotella sp.]|nr:sel1 repeat family protein [Prevotella sp.]